ncbi:MAG: serine/threonine-protein kinase [Pseudomonadota bacterium]
MHADWTGSSSSDVVLRCYAPPLLSEPYRNVVSGWGNARDKLSRRLGFLETLLRYMVAIYSADSGEVHVGAYEALLGRLAKPTLGVWFNAAEGLARAVVTRPGAVAPDLAGILWDTFAGQRPSRTAVARNLKKLIEVRNLTAHTAGSTFPSEEGAVETLEEIREPLRAVLHGLSPLRAHPLLCVEEYPTHGLAKVLRFSPAGIDTFEVACPPLAIERREPFLVSATGDVLRLGPWLRISDQEGLCSALLCNPRHDGDLATLRERLPRHDAVLRGVFSDGAPGRLRDFTSAAGAPEIPGYDVDGPLGRGGAGSVWLARAKQSTSTERVAVKVLHRANIGDAQARARLHREYQFLASQPHPAVVGARDFGESSTAGPFLVMEYVQGMDLESMLREAPLEPDQAAHVVMEVLDALTGPHAQGHVHRDLKPANLILDARGHVRIIDFGIAAVAGATRLTRTLQAVGTRDYMAPEQLSGGTVDPRTDLYALGRTLEDLVRGGGQQEGCQALPPGLVAVVRRATQALAEDRFQNAQEMKLALQQRHRARWGGAPVMERDRLNDSFAVWEARGHWGEQAWLFHGVRVATGEPVGLLVAELGSAGALLYAAHHDITREQRHELDYAGIHHTAPSAGMSYPFAVFDGIEKLDARVEAWLGGGRFGMLTGQVRRAPLPTPAAKPAPVAEPAPTPTVPSPSPAPAVREGPVPASAPTFEAAAGKAAGKAAAKAGGGFPTAAILGVLAGGAVAGVAGALGGAVIGSQIAKGRKQAAAKGKAAQEKEPAKPAAAGTPPVAGGKKPR